NENESTAVPTPATPASGEWKVFAPPGGCFSILMPATPAHSTKKETQAPEGGAEVQQFLAKAPQSDVQYSVHYFDVSDVPPSSYQFLVQMKMYASMALTGSGPAQDEKEITLKLYPGREYTFDLPGKKTALRKIYLVENRVFLLTISGPPAVA